jgi:hypothetical protein
MNHTPYDFDSRHGHDWSTLPPPAEPDDFGFVVTIKGAVAVLVIGIVVGVALAAVVS